MSSLHELDHLRISFHDIQLATDSFADHNLLGEGGFGQVYKGQLPLSTGSSSEPHTPVAIKRLGRNEKSGQGGKEFLKEIFMLTSYKHDNLVSLLGFCEQGDEKILVYKQELNGSLDKHLASIDLTWEQRLRICLGAARGLEYLHEGVGEGHRVFHRDIKSANILLDQKWEAKISDFGLSTIGPTNQQLSFLATNACGTSGYVDPLYVKTGELTKESDVYSFGVVLFEVLCGTLVYIGKNEYGFKYLPQLVKHHHEKAELKGLIMPHLLEQSEQYSLYVFSEIAFNCLNEDGKERPTMGSIVQELEIALTHQLGTLSNESHPQIATKTELWGSQTGGDSFSFQLKSNQRLRKISIFEITIWGYVHKHVHGIHSLIFTVEDSDGSLHSEQYGGTKSYNRGYMLTIDFDRDEELVGLSGTVGRFSNTQIITSLSFKTNKRTHGPFGSEKHTRFSTSWEVGQFEGFFGRCGWYIDAIGCLLKAIN